MTASSSQPTGSRAPSVGAPPAWRDVLVAQEGVITRRQARLGGMSEDGWQWQLDTGRWQGVLPGVVVAHSGGMSARELAWAAVLAHGAGSWLSADAALIELGMQLPTPGVHHTVVAPRREVKLKRSRHVGVHLLVQPHPVRLLPSWTRTSYELPLLRAEVALVHSAEWAPSDRAAEWRVAAAVQQGLVRPSDVQRALLGMPRLGRRGLVGLVLDEAEQGAHALSELDFLRFLDEHHLPRPDRLQRLVRAGGARYVDAWWERQRVGVELDGAHHRTAGTWDADLLRANDIVLVEQADRVLLLRLTTGTLRHDRPRVAQQLRSALT